MKTYTKSEIAEILKKHKAWLEDYKGGERADLSDADLSGADLSKSQGIEYSSVSFSGHRELGRLLTAALIDGEAVYYCGCFKGSESEIRQYIESGEEELKESRSFACEFVKKALEMSVKRKKNEAA